MEKSEAREFVDMIASGNVASLQTKFESMMIDPLARVVENHRKEVAQKLFGDRK
jgi:hypothetical protein